MNPAQPQFLQLRNSQGEIYFDHASQGLLPLEILENLESFPVDPDQQSYNSLHRALLKSFGRKFHSVFYMNSVSEGLGRILDRMEEAGSTLAMVDPAISLPLANLPRDRSYQSRFLELKEGGGLDFSQLPGRISEERMIVLLNHLHPLLGTERKVGEFTRMLQVQSEVEKKDLLLFVEGSLACTSLLPPPECDLYLLSFELVFGFPGYLCFCSERLAQLLSDESDNPGFIQEIAEPDGFVYLPLQIFSALMDSFRDLREGVCAKPLNPQERIQELVRFFLDSFPQTDGWEIHSSAAPMGLVFVEGPALISEKVSRELRDFGIIHSFGTLQEMNLPFLNLTDQKTEKQLFRFSIQWYNSKTEIKKLNHLLRLLMQR